MCPKEFDYSQNQLPLGFDCMISEDFLFFITEKTKKEIQIYKTI